MQPGFGGKRSLQRVHPDGHEFPDSGRKGVRDCARGARFESNDPEHRTFRRNLQCHLRFAVDLQLGARLSDRVPRSAVETRRRRQHTTRRRGRYRGRRNVRAGRIRSNAWVGCSGHVSPTRTGELLPSDLHHHVRSIAAHQADPRANYACGERSAGGVWGRSGRAPPHQTAPRY
jgi:hypothetical protein